MSRRTQLVHPFTFFLVHAIELSYDALLTRPPNIMYSIKALYWLTAYLDEDGKKRLDKQVREMNDIVAFARDTTFEDFRRLLTDVMTELHKQGYFLAAKMTPETRATSMDALKKLGMEKT